MADRKIKMYPVTETFGIKAPKEAVVPGFEPDPNAPAAHLVPAVDPNHVFPKDFLRDILAWWRGTHEGFVKKEGFFCFGPKGSGKSSGILQVAARLNIPVFRDCGSEVYDVEAAIAHPTVIGGDTMMADGPMTMAARIGAWFLLDEVDQIEPSNQVGFNPIAEGSSWALPRTGEVITPHPNFRFFATGNSNFGGDATGLYQGVKRQNSAFGDRWFITKMDYIDPESEKAILKNAVPGITDVQVEGMVKFANMIRSIFRGEESGQAPIEIELSTRSLVRWAVNTAMFQNTECPIVYAMDRAFGFGCDPETRDVLVETLQRVFGKEVTK
ncbi:AAA family ATPase [Geoalkalibacter subterraneus]|uniref:ATPase dynein-related AAA domain-containing protein n=1 Tax=Geoalkalibacter subterraneus TaxID=483547 RepID=A0A0B5FVG8_9BACT|nr:AAA family ATPase [Geoalkalibacter subterraneus]AJF08170.1 hypothetical protein GSUB_16850 [Geoalkalibacter subterraneus]